MSKFSVLILVFVLSLKSQAQDKAVQSYGDQISIESLRENLSIIASDALEGRETGKRGQKMAAAFIQSYFRELDLMPPVNGGYYQPFELYTSQKGDRDIYVKAGDQHFPNFSGIVYESTSNTPGEITSTAVFAGYGNEWETKGLDMKEKAVVILKGKNSYVATVNALVDAGVKYIFIACPDSSDFADANARLQRENRRQPLGFTKPEITTMNSAIFFITAGVAEKIFSVKIPKLVQASSDAVEKKSGAKKIPAGKVTFKGSIDIKTVTTENVLGYLEGTDKKEELIVVTAHYDHIGKRKSGTGDLINNGADDDGSGTVAVLELAKIFSKAKKEGKGPRRSILFMTVTAEEIGLYGSDYYTRNPVFPLEKTVVDLNIDMIGRRDAAHKDSAYVYVIGADKLSKELNSVSEQINKTYTQLSFDYLYNDESHPDRLYYRSDHWNFARKNIPIIFYFDGIHEDYHRVSDEVEKIEFDLLRKRTQCIFYTAWEIANRDQTIKPDPKTDVQK